MNLVRQKLKISIYVILTCILALLIVVPTSAVTDVTLNDLYYYGSYYYNPEGGCIDGSGSIAGTVSGDDNESKIWNYFVTANIEGISTNPAAIAGILGNLKAESGFNPYNTNGTYYGIYQTNSSGMIAAVNALGGNYWAHGETNNAPVEINDKAIGIELDWLVNDKFAAPEKRFGAYIKSVLDNNISNSANGAKIYAELFMVAVERCIGGNEPLVYQEAKNLTYTLGIGRYANSGWQGTTKRSDYAAEIYEKYASANAIPTTGTGGNTSGNTPSSNSANDGSNITIIGDSITVASTDALQKILLGVDIHAKVGRQFAKTYDDSGTENLEKIISDNGLRDTLVFALGTNDSNLKESQVQEVLDLVKADGNHKIIFVTNYNANDKNAYAQNNALLSTTASKNSNVTLVDWAGAVSANPSKYLNSDGIHPTAEGQELFATLIRDAINSANSTPSAIDYCNTGGGNSPYTGTGIPQYFQCDNQWGGLMFGSGGIHGSSGSSICDSGCGPTSFAMMATALLGKNILPSETADVAGKANMHVAGAGSSWEITKVLANHYGLQYKDLGTCNVDTISQYLRDGWMIHTSGKGSAPFTSGGHYIGIAGINSNGEWYIANSAGHNNANKYYSPNAVVNAGMACGNVKAIKK